MILKAYSYIIPIILITTLFSCNSPNNCRQDGLIKQYSLTRQSNNLLRYDLTYTLKDSARTVIEVYQSQNEKPALTFSLPLSNKIDQTIYGIKANTKYNLLIKTGGCIIKSDSFKTENISITSLTGHKIVKDKWNEGYIVYHQANKDSGQYHVIIDHDANLVWYQHLPKSVSTFSITPRNTLLALLYTDEIIEVDFSGKTLFNLKLGEKGFDHPLHHEIQMDKDGNIYGLTYHTLNLSDSQKQLYGVDSLTSDGILVLDSNGNKIIDWNMFLSEMPPAEDFKPYMQNDWSHGNALWQIDKDNYLLSFKNLDQIWSVNATTNQINWKLGQNGDFKMAKEDYFTDQHSAHFNNSRLIVFDNGNRKTGLSRGLEFGLDTERMNATLASSAYLPDYMYSFKRGNAQKINTNTFLLNSSMTNSVGIVNATNEILFELSLPQSTYRAYFLEDIFE